ncbi:hypothetical protein BHE74_00011948 [Ensete ventricosum]|nr:hypothetical protein BHE74_00011948 [Ensete ventricosum]
MSSLFTDISVDGLVKCEKWIRDDDNGMEESKATWWLNRLIGRTKKISVDWPYPFVEDKLFVLTLSAGLEGYHVNVDGRHVTSFPYRTNLEMSAEWQALPLPDGPVELFIGILSAGNHFAERMAVRKSWMREHGRKEVNIELKKEAEFFGDIVIVPFLDSYDLVVLKTVAICEYGVFVMDLLLQEWPEENYPPYANGPGYVVSSDIARFIISDFEKHKLRVSIFNSSMSSYFLYLA